jgi:hypothetical protein
MYLSTQDCNHFGTKDFCLFHLDEKTIQGTRSPNLSSQFFGLSKSGLVKNSRRHMKYNLEKPTTVRS